MRKRPLRHDEEVNLHDQLNRDIGHRVLQLGMSMVKRTVWTMGTASAKRRGRTCTTCTTRTSITVIQQLGNNYGPTNSLDHGNMPLRHEGNLHDLYTGTWTTVCTAKENHDGLLNSLIMGMSLCGTTGKSTTLKMGCNCGKTKIRASALPTAVPPAASRARPRAQGRHRARSWAPRQPARQRGNREEREHQGATVPPSAAQERRKSEATERRPSGPQCAAGPEPVAEDL